MRDADAVLTIIPVDSAKSSGTELGKQEAEKLHELCFIAYRVEDVPKIARWLEALLMIRGGATELCVGGPRASECQEAYQITTRILEGVWEFLERGNGILEESE